MSSFSNVIAVFVAGVAMQSGVSAQFSHIAPSDSLLATRAALAAEAFQEEVTVPSSDGLVPVNTTGAGTFTFEGHVLTVGDGYQGVAAKILYCPSEADDANYRAAISAAAGGATVDYFDTRAATPSVATLSQYDAVYTWVNFAYADEVGLGNNLAAYNDAGGTVVLGVFCTYTSGNNLSGAIMTPAYCPVVSPLGNNHFSNSSYVGNGTTCIYDGVTTLSGQFRDFLVTQGTGVVDGTYADGEICHAYRATGAGGDVIYSNGAGAVQLGALVDWGKAVGHACTCGVGVNPWTDEGSALGGVSGDPALAGAGTLAEDTKTTLTLSNAAGSALSIVVIAGGSTPTAFKGGVFLPGPAIVSLALLTSPAGGWTVAFRAPAMASGAELWAQAAIADAAAVQGVALSNAVKGTKP